MKRSAKSSGSSPGKLVVEKLNRCPPDDPKSRKSLFSFKTEKNGESLQPPSWSTEERRALVVYTLLFSFLYMRTSNLDGLLWKTLSLGKMCRGYIMYQWMTREIRQWDQPCNCSSKATTSSNSTGGHFFLYDYMNTEGNDVSFNSAIHILKKKKVFPSNYEPSPWVPGEHLENMWPCTGKRTLMLFR